MTEYIQINDIPSNKTTPLDEGFNAGQIWKDMGDSKSPRQEKDYDSEISFDDNNLLAQISKPIETDQKDKAEDKEKNANQWEFDSSPKDGVDRLKLRSEYKVSREDFFKANPKLENKIPQGDENKNLKLRHPTTGQVDDHWSMKSENKDGSITLTREYEIDVQAKEDHQDLIEALPGVPSSFTEQLNRKLMEMPDNVRNSLKRHGYKIVAAPTIPDAIPGLENLTPRGWPAHKNFYNSDGTHDDVSKRIISPMRYLRGENMAPVMRENVLTHQVGHALDFAHGFLSSTPEFIEAYNKDFQRLQGSTDPRARYLSQAKGVGRQETFAAIFGQVLTGPENERDREFLTTNFPEVTKVVKNQIKKLR